MSISGFEINVPDAVAVSVTDESLSVDLADGRTLSVPLGWYPRLEHGTAAERNEWRFIGGGEGIHWPRLDEHISIEGLLAGRPSQESRASLKKWMAGRANKRVE